MPSYEVTGTLPTAFAMGRNARAAAGARVREAARRGDCPRRVRTVVDGEEWIWVVDGRSGRRVRPELDPRQIESWEVVRGDCVDVMSRMPDECVDSGVIDPPSGIGFMAGSKVTDTSWDDFRRARNRADAGRESVFGRTSRRGPEYGRGSRANFVAWMTRAASELHRVLRPGAHALVWAIPRTSHWTGWALEDAGFEIRDVVDHCFGNGFPKSLNVSKAIDKRLGRDKDRPVVGPNPNHRAVSGVDYEGIYAGGNTGAAQITAAASDEAARWDGWGTALKPMKEHWILVRKPLQGTVAGNVLTHGVGAINVDGCRVGSSKRVPGSVSSPETKGWMDHWSETTVDLTGQNPNIGRWPPNLVMTHSADCRPVGTTTARCNGPTAGGGASPGNVYEFRMREQSGGFSTPDGKEEIEEWECVPGCPVGELNAQGGTRSSGSRPRGRKNPPNNVFGARRNFELTPLSASKGPASRYLPTFHPYQDDPGFRYVPKASPSERNLGLDTKCPHPTVKPIALMRWLVRLITPPRNADGERAVVLDFCAGSGTTGIAAVLEGHRFLGIEQNPEFAELAVTRIRAHTARARQPGLDFSAGIE